MTKTFTCTQARARLASLCKDVTDDSDYVIITRAGQEDVALISASELSSLIETAHILSSPKNAERLATALNRAKAGTEPAQTVGTMTADELLVMPHNGYRYELIRGELRQMAPAGRQHGRIAATICSRLESFVRNNNLGEIYAAETGFLIWTNPDTVRAPDASFVSRARADATDEEEGFFPGAPDLAVEVISPNDRAVEVEDKALDWLRAGAKMVIVLNPKTRTATIYRGFDDIRILTEGDTIDGGDVVPGWQLPLADVF